MSGGRTMPTIAEYELARGITRPPVEALPSVTGRGEEAAPAQDLITYITNSLPKWSDLNKTHMYIALGVAFVGLVGGGIIYMRSRGGDGGAGATGTTTTIQDDTTAEELTEKVTEETAEFAALKAELERRRSGNVITAGARPEGALTLHQCPRGRKTPCIAPYPLKLETFLRTQDIVYQVDFGSTEPRNSESPWLTLENEDVADSKNCIRFLCEKYSLDPQKHLSIKDKSLERACHHLLEHHLYWGISLYRWVYDGARSLDKIQYLPKSSHVSIPDVCRTVEQAAWYHGIGKKSPEDVVNEILRDLASLSRILGEKKFFLSNVAPTELDCTAFSMLAQMMWTMEESPYHAALTETYRNLGDFCWGMRHAYWPDWDNCLHDGNSIQTLD